MLNQQSPIRQYFSFLSPPRLLVKTLPHIQTSGSPYGLVQVRISYLLYLQIPYWENIYCFSLHFFNTLSPTLYQHTSRTHADLHVAPKMFSGWNLGSLFFPDIPMFEMYSLLSGRATVLTPEKHPRAEGRQKETVTYRNGQRHFVEYSKKFS